ncbi:MAG: hypothetical protein R3F13_13250 [Prosthecobacter sp.]
MKTILAILTLAALCACENFKTAAVPLAELGLEVAVAKGLIKSGDAVLITKSAAIITSDEDATRKAVSLATLGADAAVASGKLSPGDKLLIDKATAIVVPAMTEAKNQPSVPVSP